MNLFLTSCLLYTGYIFLKSLATKRRNNAFDGYTQIIQIKLNKCHTFYISVNVWESHLLFVTVFCKFQYVFEKKILSLIFNIYSSKGQWLTRFRIYSLA